MQHQSQEYSGKIAAKKKERQQKWLNAVKDSDLGRPLGRHFLFKHKEKMVQNYVHKPLVLAY